MKGTEKRMKAQTTMFGRMVKCYNLPLDEIAELNTKYETAKEKISVLATVFNIAVIGSKHELKAFYRALYTNANFNKLLKLIKLNL